MVTVYGGCLIKNLFLKRSRWKNMQNTLRAHFFLPKIPSLPLNAITTNVREYIKSKLERGLQGCGPQTTQKQTIYIIYYYGPRGGGCSVRGVSHLNKSVFSINCAWKVVNYICFTRFQELVMPTRQCNSLVTEFSTSGRI